MRQSLLALAGGCLVALTLLMPALMPRSAHAVEPADNMIKAALYDLDRVEQQLFGLDPASAAKVKRVRDALDMAAERLAQSPNQGHASWLEAKGQLDRLRQALETAVTAAAAPPAAVPARAQAATGAKAPPPAVTAEAQAIVERFNRLVSHYNLDVPQLQKVTEADLDDPDIRRKWRTRMAFYAEEMAVFQPYLAEPNVKTMDDNVKGMIAWYDALESKVLARLESFGDIDAKIAELQARYDHGKLPRPLEPPLTAQAIQAWAAEIRAWQTQAETDRAWLERLLATTETRAFDARNLVEGSIDTALPNAIERAVDRTREVLLAPVAGLEPWAGRVLAIDLADEHAVKNNLDGDHYEDLLGRLGDAVVRLETSQLVDRAFALPENAETARQIAYFAQARQDLERLHHQAVAGARMPGAQSSDPELLQAAATVLGGDSYGYAWERMVINYAPRPKEETRAWWEADGIGVATYVWDEFQVATAEATANGHAIFFNELRYYHSADPTVPTGRWILHKRFQGGTILPEHIDE